MTPNLIVLIVLFFQRICFIVPINTCIKFNVYLERLAKGTNILAETGVKKRSKQQGTWNNQNNTYKETKVNEQLGLTKTSRMDQVNR